MRFSNLFSSGALNRLAPTVADMAHSREALAALDSHLLRTAKQKGPISKFMTAYGKYVAKPASSAGTAFYGGNMDMPKILATMGGTVGGIRYGGEAARPMYNYLHNIASGINETAMKSDYYSKYMPDSVVNIMKPSIAITSKPLTMLDNALDGALHMADNPILATLALPIAAYTGLKGGSALLSRLGRGRRLKQLSRGIAPRAYRQQARQLGYR